MLFTSGIYILFLLLVVALFWFVPVRFRIPLLLIASYVFYMAWSPPFGLIYGPLIFVDSLYFYGLSHLMVRYPIHKKLVLIIGVSSELTLLAFFKYANFLLGVMEDTFGLLQIPITHTELHIFLPLAISFTNFILIAYLVDVYRGKETPDTWLRFCTYVAFFPHLIAGPIVRASELLRQFDQSHRFRQSWFIKGIHTFLLGFMIKSFVADQLAPYVNLIYGTPHLQGFDTAWLATYAFALQIFTDFWGYTLMAQGSALLLGYALPDNFNAPYFSVNITEFWRRWHMSLSRWLRDYLYIPLGGSRGSRFETYRNLFLTMGLGGLWHGASWNFVIWGLIHGLYLSLHKLCVFLKINRFIPPFVAGLLTFHAVCLAWVFFRAQTFPEAVHLLSVMFNPASNQGFEIASTNTMDGYSVMMLVTCFLIGHGTCRLLYRWFHKNKLAFDTARGIAYAGLVYLLITVKVPPQEFLYFQF